MSAENTYYCDFCRFEHADMLWKKVWWCDRCKLYWCWNHAERHREHCILVRLS